MLNNKPATIVMNNASLTHSVQWRAEICEIIRPNTMFKRHAINVAPIVLKKCLEASEIAKNYKDYFRA